MAVAAVMARRAAAAAESETPKVASLPLVSQKQRPGSALSNRSAASSRPLRPVIVAAEPMAETPKPVHSEESDRDLKSGEPSVSKALTSYSRKEVDDHFQEILEEQGVADVMDEEEETPKVPLVERTEFESFIGIMIAINAVLMGFEVDLAQTGDVGWIVVENFFCILWISEMVLKMKTLHRQYFMNAYNLLDFALVLLAVAEAWVIPFLFIDGVSGLAVIRMVRILRMLRLLRLIRLMKLFKNLWLIIVGFRESLSTLFWVLMLLTVVIYVFAIFLRYTLNCFGAFREWDDCAEYFGSMPAAMYTLFQVITLESWSQVFTWPILKVQPAFFIVFLLFLFLTTFGILNIIVGVIVENTLNAAKQNQELQERRLQRQLRQELESIRRLFEEADSDGSGTLERSEFVDILSDPTVQQTLTRMEVPVEDPGMLFEILDPSETDSLSFPSFAQGVLRVKGPPTQLDMKTMQLGVANISRRVNKVEQYLDQHSAMLERNAVMLGILMTKLGCHDQMPPSVSGPFGHRSRRGSRDSRGPGGGAGTESAPATMAAGEGLEQDAMAAMEVESMGDEDPGELTLEKTFSNDSLEIPGRAPRDSTRNRPFSRSRCQDSSSPRLQICRAPAPEVLPP